MDADQSHPHEEVVVDERRPWPGLVPFREAHRHFFFGRGHEQEELLRSIRRGINMLLFGESGLGKTSLLQAGLFPRLRESGYLPVLVRLAYHPEALAPSDQVKLLLNRAIDDAGLDAARRIEPQETLWEYFHRREFALVDRSGEPIVPVIVFDQFEEFFTLGLNQRKADCQVFLSELSDLMENRPPAAVKARLERSPSEIARYVFNRDDYRIVIAMREDFLPSLEMFRASAPSLGRNRFRLTRLKGRQALEAVVEPGRGIVSEEVARRIVSLVGGGPANDVGAHAIADIEVESSLLSLFCSELNERRLAAGQAQITAELVELSRRDILRSFYERAVTDQPQAVREFIEDQLVTDSGARDSIARERAEGLLADKGVRANVIDELVRRRLLHIEERRGGPRVELIHDVLLEIVRRGKVERSSLALRQALARTRRRYLVRAAAVVAIVTLFASTLTYMSAQRARDRAAEAQKLEEQNDRLMKTLEDLMPVLGKFVEPSDDQSLGRDKILNEPLITRIIGLADERRRPGYDSPYMSVKTQSLVILARVVTPSASSRCTGEGPTGGCGGSDEGSKYIDEATQMAVELLRQGKTRDDISKGYDAFDAIAQAWESRRNTELALASMDRTIEILQQINPGALNPDELNWFVGSAAVRQAGIMWKASRFDAAEAKLRSGVRQLSDAKGALSLAALVDLYSNLGEVLLSARDRATDEATKRRAMEAALIEFEHAWEKAGAFLRLQDTIWTRDWIARYAGRVAGLYKDMHSVEQARLFYRRQLIARRELVPDESKPLTTDVERAKRDLASALMDLGFLERTQGDKSEAIERHRECVTSMEALVGKSSAPANQQSLGFCYAGLADSLHDDGKREQAIANYQKALAIQEKLAAAEPGDADRQSALAYVYGGLAGALLADGNREEAIANYQKAAAIQEKLAAAEPDNARRQSALAYVHGGLAEALLADGKRAKAITAYQRAVAIQEKLAAAEPDNARQSALAYVYGRLAGALLADDKREQAIANYQKALAIQEKLAAAEPGDADRQSALAYVYGGLAGALLADDKREEAIANYQKAVAIQEKLAAAEPGDADRQSALADVYGGLAGALLADGNREKATANYQKALAIQEKLAAAEPDNARRQSALAYVYGGLADALLADGKREEAIANYQKALAIWENLATARPDDADQQDYFAEAHRKFAGALLADGKPAEAHPHYQKALAMMEQVVAHTEQAEVAANGKSGVATAERLNHLAWHALFAREFGKALGAGDRTLGIALENRAHELTFRIHTNRAHALMFLRHVDEAQSLYLQYRGTKNVVGAKSWETVILEDFAELRAAGLSDPLMAEIERRFAAGR